MKEDLQNKLYEKYPKIFAEKDLPPSQTCMTRGLECGAGWYAIIDVLCTQIKYLVEKHNVPEVVFTQVKEKYGALTIYYRGGNEVVHHLVSMADLMSQSTCENCGTTQNVSVRGKWFVQAVCDDCYDDSDDESSTDDASEEGKPSSDKK